MTYFFLPGENPCLILNFRRWWVIFFSLCFFGVFWFFFFFLELIRVIFLLEWGIIKTILKVTQGYWVWMRLLMLWKGIGCHTGLGNKAIPKLVLPQKDVWTHVSSSEMALSLRKCKVIGKISLVITTKCERWNIRLSRAFISFLS